MLASRNTAAQRSLEKVFSLLLKLKVNFSKHSSYIKGNANSEFHKTINFVSKPNNIFIKFLPIKALKSIRYMML